jgi:hypothetical protein
MIIRLRRLLVARAGQRILVVRASVNQVTDALTIQV